MRAVRVLGSLEVDENDNSVALGSPRERAVIAWLAVRAPEVVSAEALMAMLWGDDPPSSAVKTVQTLVYRARRCVGDDGIVTVGKGTTLTVNVVCFGASADTISGRLTTALSAGATRTPGKGKGIRWK